MDAIGEALEGEPVNPEAVAARVSAVGRATCSACHHVHVPAAYARD